MGWSVGWDADLNRYRGYGVPAFCDAKAAGCTAKIDRGLAYGCGPTEDELPHLFTCADHDVADVDENDLPGEHPLWLQHVLTDDSWATWRIENPDQVQTYRHQLEQNPGPRDGGE